MPPRLRLPKRTFDDLPGTWSILDSHEALSFLGASGLEMGTLAAYVDVTSGDETKTKIYAASWVGALCMSQLPARRKISWLVEIAHRPDLIAMIEGSLIMVDDPAQRTRVLEELLPTFDSTVRCICGHSFTDSRAYVLHTQECPNVLRSLRPKSARE